MATTPIKVKAFADKYGLTSKEVLKELAAQGYDNIRTASNNMPMEDLPLIESYFDELMEKRNPQSALIEEVESRMESRSGGQNNNKKRSGEEQNQGGKRDKNFGKGGKFPPRDNGSSADIPAGGEIHIKPPVVVKALADAMGKRPNEVISSLMMMNVLASINQTIDTEIAQKVAEKMGFTLVVDSKRDKDEHQKKEETEEVDPEDMEYDDSPKDLKPRPPIVTFMGHVDHGKTSLQDAIRKTHVAAGEAGGITQHIGASSVVLDGKAITFVDTPGHEAFTQMRARGANVTDIVVLVVAADDGFMPQTIEAMNHALAAKVPIVVAMNKCDLPDADTQKILLHMQQNNLVSEDWGGTVAAIPVSAKTGAGIDDLLERILLEAEMLELQANAKRPGLAYVLESQLEQGLGATASVVVKNGSLRVGDPIICGEYYGKIKTLIDFRGKRVAVAPPSTPVKVVGLSGVPEAGTKMAVCKNINEAKQLAETRSDSNRIEALSSKTAGASLEDLFSQMDDSKKNSLKVIVKSDVRGSSEAIVESLKKLPSEKISVDVLHTGVGAITENDVLLAASSDAIVVGFHVRVNPGVNDLAKKSNVEIRLYSIIYELIEDITDALAGRLEPEKREKDIGTVKILKIFQLSKGPKICGCMVEKGVARTGAKARVFRNNELIFNGEVRSLRRYQDDVKEVHQGLECGIRLDNFMDFTEGDIIQLYEIELKKATLT
ncbi:MAG: translation initiation factor IF-2 [Lentisphaeria bacterium]|nr:translation initiation factor IF-2 [Lentisphaeria bacterium]